MLNNTQFLDFMKSFMNPELYTNSMKNMPNLDLSSFNGTCQKLMNVLTTTNQMATESMHAMVKKNSETFQNNTSSFLNSAKEAMNAGGLKQMAECHQKCINSASEASINNIKEISSIASEFSKKVFDVLNEGVKKNMDVKVKA